MSFSCKGRPPHCHVTRRLVAGSTIRAPAVPCPPATYCACSSHAHLDIIFNILGVHLDRLAAGQLLAAAKRRPGMHVIEGQPLWHTVDAHTLRARRSGPAVPQWTSAQGAPQQPSRCLHSPFQRCLDVTIEWGACGLHQLCRWFREFGRCGSGNLADADMSIGLA